MSLVTISDHNTLDGALRIADRPGAFLSVEVTTCFPEDEMPLHVLVWNLSEEDHADLQPFRGSVYELVAFLGERGLAHGLAHPLYRMGPTITASHIERMMLLFGTGRGETAPDRELQRTRLQARRGGEPRLRRKAGRPARFRPAARGSDRAERRIRRSRRAGHRDLLDTGAWRGRRLLPRRGQRRSGRPGGEHGSTVKLAHAVGALAADAYRLDGRELPSFLQETVVPLFEGHGGVETRHEEITVAASTFARLLGERARSGGLGLDALPTLGARVGSLLLAGGLELPYLAAMRHHVGTRADVETAGGGLLRPADRHVRPACGCLHRYLQRDQRRRRHDAPPRARRRTGRARAAGRDGRPRGPLRAGVMRFESDWSLPLPSYEGLVARTSRC